MDRGAQQGDGIGVEFIGGGGFVVLESLCQFVCVLQDLLNRAGHGHHLRNFSLARIAWTMTTAVSPSM
jgi:hypothetical protein